MAPFLIIKRYIRIKAGGLNCHRQEIKQKLGLNNIDIIDFHILGAEQFSDTPRLL